MIYLALLLRNVVRSLLQNIDHVKMLHVNLRNLFHCCYFFSFLCVDFCCTFCSVLSIILWWIKMYIYIYINFAIFWQISRVAAAKKGVTKNPPMIKYLAEISACDGLSSSHQKVSEMLPAREKYSTLKCFRQWPPVPVYHIIPPREQQLSYRKQIARQLHTQYVEDMYRPKYYTVTLKSRLGVT